MGVQCRATNTKAVCPAEMVGRKVSWNHLQVPVFYVYRWLPLYDYVLIIESPFKLTQDARVTWETLLLWRTFQFAQLCLSYQPT